MSCRIKKGYSKILLIMDTIRNQRIKNGITQEELAESIGVSPRQMQRIENNESSTKISTLKKIIKELNMTDEQIIKIMRGE